MRLVSFRWPKQPYSGSPPTSAGWSSGSGQAGCGIRAIGPRKPDLPRALLDVARVDDQPGRVRRAPRRRAGSPRAASPTAAAACCRARRRRAAGRRGRPRAPSRRGSRRRRRARRSDRRRGGGGRSRAGRRRRAAVRSASTIQPCASASLPTWYSAMSACGSRRKRPGRARTTSIRFSSSGRSSAE